MLTRIAQENPHEFYSKLVADYKKYDANQKRVIEDLVEDNKKLRFKIGQLESYIEEFVSDGYVIGAKSKIKSCKDEISHLRQACFFAERKLIELLYPQYAAAHPDGLLSAIHRVISAYVRDHQHTETERNSK